MFINACPAARNIRGGWGDTDMNDAPGFLDGRHFTEYVDDVKRLRHDGKNDEAIALLVRLVSATEADAIAHGYGVAPWYYEQLAIAYRKLYRREEEVRILQRFAEQPHAPGVG